MPWPSLENVEIEFGKKIRKLASFFPFTVTNRVEIILHRKLFLLRNFMHFSAPATCHMFLSEKNV